MRTIASNKSEKSTKYLKGSQTKSAGEIKERSSALFGHFVKSWFISSRVTSDLGMRLPNGSFYHFHSTACPDRKSFQRGQRTGTSRFLRRTKNTPSKL